MVEAVRSTTFTPDEMAANVSLMAANVSVVSERISLSGRVEDYDKEVLSFAAKHFKSEANAAFRGTIESVDYQYPVWYALDLFFDYYPVEDEEIASFLAALGSELEELVVQPDPEAATRVTEFYRELSAHCRAISVSDFYRLNHL